MSDLATSVLDSEGGAGAELRGHVPDDPSGVVLILHGGAEHGRMPVAWWRLPVLRMVPFASTITRRAGDDLAVLRLKNRVRGWNGSRQDPVHDARWALDRIRRTLPGRPVVVVGHSMGGRVALHLGSEPDVAGVVALAPWIESDARQPRPGTPVLLVHGTRDRITDPRRTNILAKRFSDNGVDVRHVRVEGGAHAMLRDAAVWHDTVCDFVTTVLPGPGRTS
ncbi:MAG TPA: alpha/beta fold hydrolase [Ornithinibacter sp.]|nr:alpha/beta fold hydrolase [Ornithinibacter sp.]